MSVSESLRSTYSKYALGNEFVWRNILNLRPSIEFNRNPPVLNRTAQQVVEDLNNNGAAKTTLEELTGDSGLLPRLQELARLLEPLKEQEKQDKMGRLSGTGSLGDGRSDKEFLVTLLDTHRPLIEPNGLLAQTVLHSQIKGIADSYFGLRTVVSDTNFWMNLPSTHAPAASQLWHRDLPEDHFIFKMFIYIEDVTSDCGPFGYVRSTHKKGIKQKWAPQTHWDGFNYRATDEDVERAGGAPGVLSFPAPAGTVLFADTTGWHKGGQATKHRRLVLQSTFSSKVALRDRKLALPPGFDAASAPAGLRYDLHAQPKHTASEAILRKGASVA